MNKRLRFMIVFLCCILIGFLLAKMDTQPHWDDTGITVMAILISCIVFGSIKPSYAWLWALIIGGFIFVFNILIYQNYGSALVFLFAFAGAYLGVFIRSITKHNFKANI